MAKTSKTAGTAPAAWFGNPDDQYETLSAMTGKNLQIAQSAGQAMLQNAFSMGQELGAFVGARLKKDVEAFNAMAGCKSFGDACRAQADFLGETARDYADQTSRMLTMTASAAADTADAVAKLDPVEMAALNGAMPPAAKDADEA